MDAFHSEALACRTAQSRWAARPVSERLRPVRAFRALVADNADELLAVVEADVGRPPGEVLGSDVLPLADACRFLERRAARILKPRKVGDTPVWLFGQKDAVHRRPWGVVGIIGTWNYPLLLNGVPIVQSLAAGNGVLWKPSEYGAASAAVMARMLAEAGFPPELFHRLPAERDAGPRLVESDIDYLVFTGSATVGRQIARRLGERLIPSTLELSGCDAMFVLDDADVELAADAAWFGLTLNRGQTCLAVRRVLVDRSVMPAFVDRLRTYVTSSGPMPLVTGGQQKHAEGLIADAVAKGGSVLQSTAGGTTAPRVVVNATPDMELCRVESFAPVAAVLEADGVEAALALEASCPYALGTSIFTRDVRRARELAGRLRPGSVCVNDVIAPTAHPGVPFGGRGASGWGVTRGAEGLLAMTTPQVVGVRGGRFRPHYGGSTPELTRLLRGVLAASHTRALGSRLRGGLAAVRAAVALGRKKNRRGVIAHAPAPPPQNNTRPKASCECLTDGGGV
jgi:acyl-CoA reductase-like NAD-dependent aldehyde dehydrogenase